VSDDYSCMVTLIDNKIQSVTCMKNPYSLQCRSMQATMPNSHEYAVGRAVSVHFSIKDALGTKENVGGVFVFNETSMFQYDVMRNCFHIENVSLKEMHGLRGGDLVDRLRIAIGTIGNPFPEYHENARSFLKYFLDLCERWPDAECCVVEHDDK